MAPHPQEGLKKLMRLKGKGCQRTVNKQGLRKAIERHLATPSPAKGQEPNQSTTPAGHSNNRSAFLNTSTGHQPNTNDPSFRPQRPDVQP